MTLNGAASYTEANALYQNNGNGTFSRMAAGAVGVLASARGNCHGGAWGDFNNDGLLDLLVVDWNLKVVLYRKQSGRTLHESRWRPTRQRRLAVRRLRWAGL